VVAWMLALPGAAWAAKGNIRNHLVVIKQSLVNTEYERALDLVQVARQEPHGTDEDVTLSLYEGILLYELRRRDEAKEAFRGAFLLRPQAELPVSVSPKIQQEAEAARKQAEAELKAMPSPPPPPEEAKAPKAPAPEVIPPPSSPGESLTVQRTSSSRLRQRAWIPAVAGGALAVAGGITWGLSRAELNKLRDGDPSLTSREEVDATRRRGQKLQTVGVSLLGVGAAGLATAGTLYLLGDSGGRPTVSLGVGPDGSAAAFVYGRWP
jgi:tetratricopeptide (TPR) repeat protein